MIRKSSFASAPENMEPVDSSQPSGEFSPQETQNFSESAQPVEQYANEAVSDPNQAAANWQDVAGIPQPEPEYLIVDWHADSRVTRQRSKEYYSSLAVIVLLLSLILFFANQVVLIFVLLSFLFISYVLASVKAETIQHMITTYGIRYRGQLYYWDQMSRFWVRNNHGTYEVHVEIPHLWFNEIILLPANSSSAVPLTVEDLIDLLGRYLPYEEPIPTQFDHWVQWLEEKFPLEKEEGVSQFIPPQPETPPVSPESPQAEEGPQR